MLKLEFSDTRERTTMIKDLELMEKIVAKNAGLLPLWHEGKENPSILFMDEIIIK